MELITNSQDILNMKKLTPEILKQMEDSGKPIIRITYEELKNARFLDDKEVKKRLLNNKK